MNYKTLFFVFTYFLPLSATSITLINDTTHPICISDHRTKLIFLAPQEKYTNSQPVPCSLFFYTQTKHQEFTFFGHLKELQTSPHAITIPCSEIFSEKIVSIYPAQFTLETKNFSPGKKKIENIAVPGSAIDSKTVHTILQALDTLPNRQTPIDPSLNPLATLLAARHNQQQKKSLTQSTKK